MLVLAFLLRARRRTTRPVCSRWRERPLPPPWRRKPPVRRSAPSRAPRTPTRLRCVLRGRRARAMAAAPVPPDQGAGSNSPVHRRLVPRATVCRASRAPPRACRRRKRSATPVPGRATRRGDRAPGRALRGRRREGGSRDPPVPGSASPPGTRWTHAEPRSGPDGAPWPRLPTPGAPCTAPCAGSHRRPEDRHRRVLVAAAAASHRPCFPSCVRRHVHLTPTIYTATSVRAVTPAGVLSLPGLAPYPAGGLGGAVSFLSPRAFRLLAWILLAAGVGYFLLAGTLRQILRPYGYASDFATYYAAARAFASGE